MMPYQPWTYAPPAPPTFPQISEPLPWHVPMEPAELQLMREEHERSLSRFLRVFGVLSPGEVLWHAHVCSVVNGRGAHQGEAFITSRALYFGAQLVPSLTFAVPLHTIVSMRPGVITHAPPSPLEAPIVHIIADTASVFDARTRVDGFHIFTNTGVLHVLFGFPFARRFLNVLDHAWRAVVVPHPAPHPVPPAAPSMMAAQHAGPQLTQSASAVQVHPVAPVLRPLSQSTPSVHAVPLQHTPALGPPSPRSSGVAVAPAPSPVPMQRRDTSSAPPPAPVVSPSPVPMQRRDTSSAPPPPQPAAAAQTDFWQEEQARVSAAAAASAANAAAAKAARKAQLAKARDKSIGGLHGLGAFTKKLLPTKMTPERLTERVAEICAEAGVLTLVSPFPPMHLDMVFTSHPTFTALAPAAQAQALTELAELLAYGMLNKRTGLVNLLIASAEASADFMRRVSSFALCVSMAAERSTWRYTAQSLTLTLTVAFKCLRDQVGFQVAVETLLREAAERGAEQPAPSSPRPAVRPGVPPRPPLLASKSASVVGAAAPPSPRGSSAARTAAPMNQWTVEMVATWLHDVVALPESEVEKFRGQRVDGATLLALSEEELKSDIGITVVGDRKKIMRERALASGTGGPVGAPSAAAADMIPESSLKFERLLGEGFFGQVHLALWHGKTKVAVKHLTSGDPAEFMQEIRILQRVKHPHVLISYGLAQVTGRGLCLICEFMESGSLLDYLRAQKGAVSQRVLLRICIDTCSAMDHLERMGIVHRDLAARNVLLRVGKGDDILVKLSDFGMGKCLDYAASEYVSEQAKPLPIKWSAPEALMQKRFSPKSDVWSFGVTCWEVFSYGDDPYSDLSSKLLAALKAGERLSKPPDCPFIVWSLSIWPCFEFEPKDRPTFELLYERLNRNWADLFEVSSDEEDNSDSSDVTDPKTGYVEAYDPDTAGDMYTKVE